MRETLALLTAPFGLWLLAAPWVDQDPSRTGRLGGTIAGAVLIVAAVLAAWRRAGRGWLRTLGALGAASVVYGAVAAPAGLAVRLAAILVGLVAVGLAFAAASLPEPSRIRAVNKGGSPLAEIKSLKVRDGKIAAPCILLGSMPETVYITPAELWKLLGALGPEVVKALPAMIVRGRADLKAARQPVAPASTGA